MYNTPIFNLIKYIRAKQGLKSINTYLNKIYPNKRYQDWKLWMRLKKEFTNRSKINSLDLKKVDREIFGIDTTRPVKGKHPRITSVSRLLRHIKTFSIVNYLNKRKLIFEWLFLKSVQKDTPDIYSQTLKGFKKYLKPNIEADNEWQDFVGHHYHWEKYRYDNGNNNPEMEDLELSYQYLKQFYQKRLTLLNLEISDNNKDKGFKQPLFGNFVAAEEKPQTPIIRLQNKLHNFNDTDKDALKMYAIFVAEFEQLHFGKQYDRKELTKVLEFLINIATRAFRQGQQQFLRFHLNNLERLGFQEKLLFENDKLPIKQYINFMSIILTIRGIDKLTVFATTYITNIIDEDEHIATYFKDVFIAFHNNYFEEVIEIINRNEQNVKPKNNLFIKLRIYTFLIRSCYEIEVVNAWKYKSSTSTLNEKLNNFETFLKRNHTNIPNIIAYQNFIKTIKILKKQPTIKELFKITQEILINPNTHQSWLLHKTEEAIDFQL